MKPLVSARSWLRRHRRLALIVSALFLAFEASRFVAVGQSLLPGWSDAAGEQVAMMLARPPWIVAVTIITTVIFFAVPMALAVYATLKVRRALSRYWTANNGLG